MTRLADALQDCLVAVATGRATLEDCPARYPDLAAELEPLLQVCQDLEKVLSVDPSPSYAQAARERFWAAVASRRRRVMTTRRRARYRAPNVAPTDGGPSPATPTSPAASTSEG